MSCTAQSLLDTATAAGYGALSERDLMECIVASACAGGSSGGTSCGDFGGAQPTFPATGCGFIIDTSNLRVWTYANGNIG